MATVGRDVSVAAARLRAGGLVAFPTETVYGLGAVAQNDDAVRRIFALKGRPHDNPLIVHIADPSWLSRVARAVPPPAEALLSALAPGPLTLVLPKQDAISPLVTAGLDTVAVRLPDHPLARALIEAVGEPLVAPSANRSGRPSPTTASHVADDYPDDDLYILDGGPSSVGVESTVVAVAADRLVLLRPGVITAETLTAVTGLPVDTPITTPATPPSPGMKHRHYAPDAPVIAVSPTSNVHEVLMSLGPVAPLGIMVDSKTKDALNDPSLVPYIYADEPDVARATAALYDALRTLDRAHVAAIVAPLFSDAEAQAYNDRLTRAATPAPCVLFVCSGNTCRSPMAEALFRAVAPAPWRADSAGLWASRGAAATVEAKRALATRGLSLDDHRATPLTIPLALRARLIVPMTKAHGDQLAAVCPHLTGRIRPLARYTDDGHDVADPYGQSQAVYDETAAALERAIARLVQALDTV